MSCHFVVQSNLLGYISVCWILKIINGKKMLVKIGIAFLVRALGALSAFLMSVIVARTLTIEEAGYFFMLFTLVSVMIPFNQLGSSIASLRFIGKAHSEDDSLEVDSIANTTTMVVMFVSVFSALILWLSSDFVASSIWHKPAMVPLLEAGSVIIVFSSLCMLIAHHFQAVQKTLVSALIMSVIIPMSLSAWVFVSEPESAHEVVIFFQVVSIITLLVSLILWRVLVGKRRLAFYDLKPLLSSCFPIWLVSIMAILTTWGGQFIAGIWVSSAEVAVFAVAQRTALLVSFILIAVNMVLSPRFAALYASGHIGELHQLASKATRWMSFIAIPVAIIVFLKNELIMSLFGLNFRDGGGLLCILAGAQLVNVVTGLVAQLLNMSGHELDMLRVTSISFPISIFLGFILTPIYGITGTAIATAIGVSAQNIGALYMVKKRLGFNVLSVKRVF